MRVEDIRTGMRLRRGGNVLGSKRLKRLLSCRGEKRVEVDEDEDEDESRFCL